MKYKLLATDLDGTLLNSNQEITQRTREAILAAQAKDVLFVPSTGRPLCGARHIATQFPGDFPVITYNGALVITSQSQRILFAQGLEKTVAKEVYTLGQAHGAPIILWEGETLYVNRDCPEVRLYQKITGADIHVLEDFDCLDEVTKIIWLVPAKDGRRFTLSLSAHFAGRCNVHTSHPSLLEFVHINASKGLALQTIGKLYGIDQSEIIAVGDGFNDASMLKYAGLSVAMQNAPQELKALCKHVTGSNDEDGVAAVIEAFLLERTLDIS